MIIQNSQAISILNEVGETSLKERREKQIFQTNVKI